VLLTSCDNILGNNNGDYDPSTTETIYDPNAKPVTPDPVHPLQGTWVHNRVSARPDEIDFDFSGTHLGREHSLVRFRYTWGVGSNWYTVNHVFLGFLYDEPTASFLTYHNEPRRISFEVEFIDENRIRVSELWSFHYTSPTPSFPSERIISLTTWNGIYTRKE